MMSLHPEWSTKLFAGEKTVEFRRRVPSHPITHVVVYATRPVACVVGYFSVDDVDSASPTELWARHGRNGSISRDRFMDYFRSLSLGYAITVGTVHRHPDGLPLEALGVRVPPQGFRYLTEDSLGAFGD
jgi:predicted transcriptional regulator